MSKKNIFMLCYYFPPVSDVGSKRSVAFAKYFRKHGWNPYVLSVKNPDKVYCSIGNEAPPEGVPTEYSGSLFNPFKLISYADTALIKVLKLLGVKLKFNYFYSLFCIPDHFIGWIPLSVYKGLKIIKKHNSDFIYVSCTPHSAAITGIILKYLSGKPLILDLRDPYSLGVIYSFINTPRFRRKIDRILQKYFIKKADIFIVNNEDTRKAYINEYPQLESKIVAIHNGFEAENLNNFNQDLATKREKFDKFTIAYTGEFYLYALSPDSFFGGLSELKKRGVINENNFQFLFYGDGKYKIDEIAKKYNVADMVVTNKRIPYKEVLQVLSKSHLQLLRIVKPMISTKLFEGIPMNLPFLATIPEGEVEAIIKKYSPSSFIVTEESSEKVAEAILNALIAYKNNQIGDNYVEEFLDVYSRENLTLKLMDVISAFSVG
jgi:glycosyltransferase involved in cell wall biosynthesis